MVNNKELFSFSTKLVEKSRKIILPLFRSNLNINSKDDYTPVTEADRKTEVALRKIISKNYPEHGIHGEEYPPINIDSQFQWVIDPIDGTKAFISGKPTFGTLIGLYKENSPILGIIDMPVLNETWLGIKDFGSYLNKTPINVSSVTNISEARIASTHPDSFSQKELFLFDKIKNTCKISVWGGDCHNYALLAGGHIDIVIENNLSWHDIAALVTVIEEAGGYISNWRGKNLDSNCDGSIIASCSEDIHHQIIDLINN